MSIRFINVQHKFYNSTKTLKLLLEIEKTVKHINITITVTVKVKVKDMCNTVENSIVFYMQEFPTNEISIYIFEHIKSSIKITLSERCLIIYLKLNDTYG